MIRTAWPLAACILLLAACANSPDLAQQAKTATLTYSAVTKNAATVLKADILSPSAEACVKAADMVAFNYEDALNQKAQDWLNAGAAEQPAIADAFTNLETLFDAATLNLTGLMTGKGVC